MIILDRLIPIRCYLGGLFAKNLFILKGSLLFCGPTSNYYVIIIFRRKHVETLTSF